MADNTPAEDHINLLIDCSSLWLKCQAHFSSFNPSPMQGKQPRDNIP